jgi:hypothetical protein
MIVDAIRPLRAAPGVHPVHSHGGDLREPQLRAWRSCWTSIVVAGLALGLPAAWLVSRGFASLFFEVQSTDAWVYAIAGGALTAVAGIAALGPARRASQVDPLVALRAE